MGTRSGNCSSSGAVLMAKQVLVVLVAVLAGTSSCGALIDTVVLPPLPPVSVPGVNVTIANELDLLLKAAFSPIVIGAAPTLEIPPGEGKSFPVEVQGPLLRDKIYFQVGTQVYSTSGAVQIRILGETGTVTFYITGNCAYKEAGLQFVTVTSMNVPIFLGCAEPVTS